jgi:hypothetical protein
MSQQRIALKNPMGWFAAGREVSRAMALLSDGGFRVYMHVCLTADRSTGRLKIAQGDLALALGKSGRSIVNYLEELRKHGICTLDAAVNQHVPGLIEVCDPFWPYVKCGIDQNGAETLPSYLEAIRQFLAARKCVKPVFNPADERLAAQLFQQHVDLKQIEHAVLLACARRYIALLNGSAVGLISGLDISMQSFRRFGHSKYRRATGNTWPRGLANLNNSGSRVGKQPEVSGAGPVDYNRFVGF